jgi:hypothetical protein
MLFENYNRYECLPQNYSRISQPSYGRTFNPTIISTFFFLLILPPIFIYNQYCQSTL